MISKFGFFVVLLFAGIVLSCNNEPTQQEAIAFNDAIVKEQSMVTDEFNKLEQIIENLNVEESKTQLKKAVETAEQALVNLDKIEMVKGGETFLESVKDFFKVNIKLANKEYIEFIDLYSLPEEEFTEEVESKLYDVLERIDAIFNESFEKMSQEQAIFAIKYKFDIVSE